MMLRDGCQALVEEELEVVVVGADAEMPTPQVWSPMANSLYEANEFPLVCRKGSMSRAFGLL
jgi:hypothetical protein